MDFYKQSIDSMCYLFLQSAIKYEEVFKEELINWAESITNDLPKEILVHIEQCIEVELREGWTYTRYGHKAFLDEVQTFIGEDYEGLLLYQVIERQVTKIEVEA